MDAVAAQHEALKMASEKDNYKHTSHPQAQWFPLAGLGLFIHWGLSSVEGRYDLSWGMIANTPWDRSGNGKNKITPAEYWKKAEVFNPRSFDPVKILTAAKAAGCTYAVMTSMHHDGYTMWPSGTTDFGVQRFLNGRDLVGEFVDGCRATGLKIGIYYSPLDWHFDRKYKSFSYLSEELGQEYMDANWQAFPEHPVFPPEHLAEGNRIYHQRIRELLTRYGKIDLLWLDGGGTDDSVAELARSIQAHIVINSRSCPGDYGTTECELPEKRFTGWFETPHCWQELVNGANQWGYFKDTPYKPAAWMLEQLILLRRWGGNLLINVSPDGNGELHPSGYVEMKKAAEWMKNCRESVIGTLPGDDIEVPMTSSADGKKRYFFFLSGRPERKVHWNSGSGKILSVRVMNDNNMLPFSQKDGVLTFEYRPDTEFTMPVAVEAVLE